MRFNLLKMFKGRQSSLDRRRREQLSHMNDFDDGFSDRFNDHFNDNLQDSRYGYQAVRPLESEISGNNNKFIPPPIEMALPSDSPRKPIIDDDEEDSSFIHVDSPSSVMSGVIPNVHRQDDENLPFGPDEIRSGGLEGQKMPPQQIPSRYTPPGPHLHERTRGYTEEDVIVLSTTESDTSVSSESTEHGKPRASARLDRKHSSNVDRPRRTNYAPQPAPYAREPTVVFTNSVNEEPSREPYQYAREGYEHQRVIAIPSATSSSMYYIVPGGMNVIFQDEDGNEITRVGDFSGRRSSPSAPFVVQDKHGREIYRHGKIDESKRCSHRSTCRDIEGNLLVFNPCQCKGRSRSASYTSSPRDTRSRSGSGSSSDRYSAPSRNGHSGRYSSEIISGHRGDSASRSPRSHSSYHSRHSSHSSNTHSSSSYDRSYSRRDRDYDRERERDYHHSSRSGGRRPHA